MGLCHIFNIIRHAKKIEIFSKKSLHFPRGCANINESPGQRVLSRQPGVAKFGIALEWGSRGPEFESRHSDQIRNPLRLNGLRIFYCLSASKKHKDKACQRNGPANHGGAVCMGLFHFLKNNFQPVLWAKRQLIIHRILRNAFAAEYGQGKPDQPHIQNCAQIADHQWECTAEQCKA